jgi:GNAT superfamily N-acetyltransferase
MTQGVTMRRAGPQDADQISALFRLVYGTSSHPFQLADAVARFSSDSRNLQVVAERHGCVVATMAMTYYPWNHSFEWGRGVTHPDARRLGLAELLSQHVVDLAVLNGTGELFFGFPRVPRILNVGSQLTPAFAAVGHDGGRNVANGRRETHLVACSVPAGARFNHVSPAIQGVQVCRFVQEAIYRPLGLGIAPGRSPA